MPLERAIKLCGRHHGNHPPIHNAEDPQALYVNPSNYREGMYADEMSDIVVTTGSPCADLGGG